MGAIARVNTAGANTGEVARLVRVALTDVGRVVAMLGLERGAKRQAGGLLICCPSHNDRTPSCSVTLGRDKTIRVRCFSCDFAGDVYHLIAAVEGLTLPRDFPRALELARQLADMHPVELAPRPRAEQAEPSGPAPIDGATFATSAQMLLGACALYSGVAVGLSMRGLLFDAQRDGWGELPQDCVGFSPDENRSELAVALDKVRAAFEPASLRWLFNDRGRVIWGDHKLLIPWRAPDGRVWGLQRRYAPLYGTEPPLGRSPKYVWPAESVYAPAVRYAYGVDSPNLDDAGELWIVEGAIDVLALRALNRNDSKPRRMAALGVPGVGAWPSFRSSILPYVKGRVVHVSLDADKAGESVVDRVAQDVAAAGAQRVNRTRPPAGAKDWAEITAKRFSSEETQDERHARRARERQEA